VPSLHVRPQCTANYPNHVLSLHHIHHIHLHTCVCLSTDRTSSTRLWRSTVAARRTLSTTPPRRCPGRPGLETGSTNLYTVQHITLGRTDHFSTTNATNHFSFCDAVLTCDLDLRTRPTLFGTSKLLSGLPTQTFVTGLPVSMSTAPQHRIYRRGALFHINVGPGPGPYLLSLLLSAV